jgi:hypothetical protein
LVLGEQPEAVVVIVTEPERERLPADRLFATQCLEHLVRKTVAVQLEIGQVHIVHGRDLRMRRMADEDQDHDPSEADPMASLSAVWYWVVVMIVLFMVGVIVLAIIQANAQ